MSRFLFAVLTALVPFAALAESALVALNRLDQVRDWRAVGLLEVAGRGTCTATLIEADLVLTAAHCVVDEDGETLPPEQVLFRAGFQHGQQAARVTGIAIAVPSAYDPRGDRVTNGFAVDVALIRLSYPILSTRVRPMGVVDLLQSDVDIAVVSYGQGRNDAPSLQSSCQLLGREQGLVVMDCAATFGSSGAPVFVMRNGGPKVASVLTGIAVTGDETHSIAVPLNRLLPQLRRQLNGLDGQIGTASGASVTILRPGDRSDTGARFVRVGE